MGPVTERSQRLTTTSDRRPVPAKGRRRNETGDEGEDSLRRCISTGESLPPERLIRFVIGPDDGLVPDLGRELPGRGVWLKAKREVVEDAVRRKLFGRAFARAGGPANPFVPDGLADLLESLLARRAAHQNCTASSSSTPPPNNARAMVSVIQATAASGRLGQADG